jgi:hypothetical protein
MPFSVRVLSLALCLMPIVACSSGDDDDDDAALPTNVSLRTDLLKSGGTLRFSCSFGTTCHGSESQSQAGLYLGTGESDAGPDLSSEQITLVYTNLVNVASRAAPAIQRVVPNQPENSFLMMKLDGKLEPVRSQCQLAPTQTPSGHPCGDVMPRGGQILPTRERDLIRVWIKEGASDN